MSETKPSPDATVAVLETREGRIEYRRAGQGPPLLLLRTGPPVGPDDPVFWRLSGTHRVFSALVPSPVPLGTSANHSTRGWDRAEMAALERWLLALVEGLGLDRPDVYTEPSLALPLAGIAARLEGVIGNALVLQPGRPLSPDPE